MSEAAKVRLVRCPKCENLLPEVTHFTVYQCGACGAVLRAKNKGVDLDAFLDKSKEERTVGNTKKLSDRYEKMMNVSDRRMMDQMSDGSESDVRSTISSSSRVERRRALHDRNEISRAGFNREENWQVEVDVMGDRRSDEIQRAKMAQDFDNESGLRRPGRVGDAPIMEKGVRGAQRHAEEGSYDHLSASSYDVDRANNVEIVGDERAELLRQLEELKDKLNRSANLNDKGEDRAPMDPYALENHRMMQNSYHNSAQFKRPPFHKQYAEPPPLMIRQEMGDDGFYHPRYAPPHVQGYGNPSRREAQASYEMPLPRTYVSGPYMELHPPHIGRHHPSCSCYHCQVNRKVSTPIFPPTCIGKYSNISEDMVSIYGDNLNRDPSGSLDCNQRILEPPPLRTHSAQSHARWPGEVNGFILRRPLRPHLAAGVKHCCPIAGGAPFMTCNNCCELLLLPKNVLNKNGSRNKLRCGACSSIIALIVSAKSLVVSFDIEATNSPTTAGREGRIDEKATEEETNASSRGDKGPTPPAGSSLQDYFEYSNKYKVAKDSGAGNRSGRSEHDKVFSSNSVARQFKRKESSATEIDISSNEFSNTGSTFESSEPTRGGRGAGSFFAGIIGAFKESHRSEESVKKENANVNVNGHLISDHLIRKAEKLAGPIQPGDYWYDFRAGFWGAIGGPCLGMIPPFIEEFKYPMPENCGGGNTSIFVNGRELNHEDVNLLASRGLPRERNR